MKKLIKLFILTLVITFTMASGVSAASKNIKVNKTKVTVKVGKTVKIKVKKPSNYKIVIKDNKYINVTKSGKILSIKGKKAKKSYSFKIKKKGYKSKKITVKVKEDSPKQKQIINDNDNNILISEDNTNYDPYAVLDMYWDEYYANVPDIKQVNNYLLVDEQSDSNTGKLYGFICGSTVDTVRWYDEIHYNTLIKEIKKIVKELHISDSMTEQEKAWRIVRYIVENTKPSNTKYEADHDHVYECLIEHHSLCMGLSEGCAALCRYVGISCDCMYSDIDAHEWNIMKIGKYWYLTDVFEIRALYNSTSGKRFNTSFLINPYNYLQYKDVNSCFLTKKYTSSHVFSNGNGYYNQCQKDGIKCYTWEELRNLAY